LVVINVEIVRIPVVSDADILLARLRGRAIAAEIGFSPIDVTLIVTAISELARSIIYHARRGEVQMGSTTGERRRGITLTVIEEAATAESQLRPTDIPDVRRVQCLVDEFEILAGSDGKTTITARKWLREN
jgi:serine/threonine-protein kinase RsbT